MKKPKKNLPKETAAIRKFRIAQSKRLVTKAKPSGKVYRRARRVDAIEACV